MMRKGIIILIYMSVALYAAAQDNILEILKAVTSNNLDIKSMVIEKQIKLLDDREALIPDDPGFSYAYFWGSPSYIGNKKNVQAGQGFKFPAYYPQQKKLNDISAELYDLQVQSEINRVLFESLELLVELTHNEVRRKVMADRLDRLYQLRDMAKQKLEAGEASRIEFEKANLLAEAYRQDFLMIESEKEILKKKLKALNGGLEADLDFDDFEAFEKVLDSASEIGPFSENPIINAAKLGSDKAEAGIRMAKTAYLPDLQLAYVSEAIRDEKLAGVQIGVSIPIWGKSNTLKKARLNRDLFENRKMMTDVYIRRDWDNNNEMALQSLKVKDNLEKSLGSLKSLDLLEQSWKLGEISLLEYLLEMPFYYEVEDRLLEAEKRYYLAVIMRNRNHLSGLVDW